MKNKWKRYLTAGILIFLFQIYGLISVMAAEGSVTYGSSSYSATEGETFQVGVYIKGSEAIGAYEFYLNYNSDMIEYVSGADAGGGGRLKFVGYGNAASYSYMLTFKAKTAGNTDISVSDVGLYPLDPNSGDSMTITTAASAPVSIQGPVTASGENRLSALTLSPTGLPGFSPDNTEYDITVDNSITKVSVSATPMDAKATFSVSDTNLAEGVNTITIAVTAENGDVKKYEVIVRRKQAETQAETTTVAAKPPETIKEEEVGVSFQVSFQVNGRDMFVTSDISSISSPSGFEKSTISYKGDELPAFVSTTKGISLFYLRDGLGSNGGFYVYDAENNNVYPYISLTNPPITYMLLNVDDSVTDPAGYQKTTVALSTGSSEDVQTNVTAWISQNDPDFFLVYAVNDSGEKGFYQYDKKEKTLQRYHVVEVQETETTTKEEGQSQPETSSEKKEEESTSDDVEVLKPQPAKEKQMRFFLILTIAVLSIVILIVVVFVFIRMRKTEKGKDEFGLEEDEFADELYDMPEPDRKAFDRIEKEKPKKKERESKQEKKRIQEEVFDMDDDFEFVDYEDEDPDDKH